MNADIKTDSKLISKIVQNFPRDDARWIKIVLFNMTLFPICIAMPHGMNRKKNSAYFDCTEI